MNKSFTNYLLAFCSVLLSSTTMKGEIMPDGSIYVGLKNGGADHYPAEVIKSYEKTEHQLVITLQDHSTRKYNLDEINEQAKYPTNFPKFTSFKFNNKYNDNVYIDVFAKIGEHEINATVGAIGKRLTPSFKTSTENATVYVDRDKQESKVSRLRFDKPINYIVTDLPYPKNRKLAHKKIKDEIWSEGTPAGPKYQKVNLTSDMLSTNLPGNDYDRLDNILDNNTATYFHSTWGANNNLEIYPYIQIDLDKDISDFRFNYNTRPHDTDNDYRPLEFKIQSSHDGIKWEDKATFTAEKDGLPTTGFAAEYESPKVSLGDKYKHIRFQLVRSQRKNYFVISELSIHEYVGEGEAQKPELISPAQYEYTWVPLGQDYTVNVDWLTDKATNVPKVEVTLANNRKIEDITKTTYLKAYVKMDGAGVFPNMEDSVLIKGRGNSTWGYNKKPYRLKFENSVKPFGLQKGKNWVLLANALNDAMMTNAIGMKIARMVETAGANDIVPVEFYCNGMYRGSYNLTQQVGFHNNSINIDESHAFLLEMDENLPDEFHFLNQTYKFNVNIKEPDLEDLVTNQQFAVKKAIINHFSHFTETVKNGNNEEYDEMLNPTMFSRYLLVNDLVDNEELKHPKSSFLYLEDPRAIHSKYIFGPVWDLDWAYGYEGSYYHCGYNSDRDYFQRIKEGKGGKFFNELFTNSPAIQRAYYKEWTDFINLHLDELLEYIDDYYAYARPSFEHNATMYSGEGSYYEEVSQRFKAWLTERADYVYNQLESFDLDTPEPIEKGDVNSDGFISIADVICIQNHLLCIENESFNSKQADANNDNKISVTDLVWVVAWAMQEPANYTRHMSLPNADAHWNANQFTLTLGQPSEMPVTVSIDKDLYAGAQFDISLPEELTLDDVILPEGWRQHEVDFTELDNHQYRVAIYTKNGGILPSGQAELHLVVKTDQTVKQQDRYISLHNILMANNAGEDERIAARSASFDMEATGIENVKGNTSVYGGDSLHIEALTAGDIYVYTIDGRLVKVCHVVEGKNSISLPTGIYIVNQEKVIINK